MGFISSTGVWLGVNMGNKTRLMGVSAWDKLLGMLPCMCWWVVQDLPSRWYENADGNQGVPYNGHEEMQVFLWFI